MRRPTSDSRAGFTIVEVVMAMFILLIGMTSILGLLSFGAALSRMASLRTQASNSIEAIHAELQETLFPLVEVDGAEAVGEPVPILDRPVPGYPGLRYSAVAVPNPGELGLPGGPIEYRVDIEIRWSNAGSKRSRSFQTLMLREVPFGERLRRRFVAGIEPEPPAPPRTPTDTRE